MNEIGKILNDNNIFSWTITEKSNGLMVLRCDECPSSTIMEMLNNSLKGPFFIKYGGYLNDCTYCKTEYGHCSCP